MKRFLVILSLIPVLAVSQPAADRSDFDFALYLLGSGLKDDAVTLMSRRRADSDTLRFLKGYVHYSLRQLDSAISCFSTVDSDSPLYTESCFFGAVSAAHSGRYRLADTLLSPLCASTDPAVRNLLLFEQAGLGLLQRDLARFDTCFARLDTDDYRLSVEADSLRRIRGTLPLRSKSPLLAAGLSAVVPGLGKVYAGHLGEGLSSFLIVGSLMAATAENLYKAGWADWKTLLFGTLSAVFYIGNIYGSAVTVRVGIANRDNQTDAQILYHIHIPLRNSYRR
ncbi:MAG: hypothetical protein AUK63_885 [bacterium P3]|nr:MAG: hypothetical protein AUK63_885 [bacterium P3]KWW41511.1 MAG: hypothetical protein F083_1073 [bacterium F083]